MLAGHPRTVNLREIDVVERLNEWLGSLFARENLDRTVAQLLSGQDGDRPDSAAREAAKARLANTPEVSRIGRAEVYAVIDSLGDIGTKLRRGSPDKVSQLYRDLGVELRFHPGEGVVEVTAKPRVVGECVRGRSCTLFTRLRIADVVEPGAAR